MLNAQANGLNEPNTTWILVAHRAGARLFQSDGLVKNLRLVEEIPHPEGRLKNQELVTDKPGMLHDKGGQGIHSTVNKDSFKFHENRQFARDLAEVLDQGRARNAFTDLILVAEPGMLGEIRNALGTKTRDLVKASFDKNLGDMNNASVAERLESLLLY